MKLERSQQTTQKYKGFAYAIFANKIEKIWPNGPKELNGLTETRKRSNK